MKTIYILIMITLFISVCGKNKKPLLFLPPEANKGNVEVIEHDSTSSDNSSDYSVNNNSNSSDETNANSSNNSDNSGDSIQASVENNDQYGSLDNSFQTIINVNVNITVRDPDGPVLGAIVSIQDPNHSGNYLYQASTNQNGNVSGSFQASTSTQYVDLFVQIGDYIVHQVVLISQLDSFLLTIDRKYSFNQDVNNQNIVDLDQDGTPDINDLYPDDSSRASKIVFPNTGVALIAFEDLYPRPGDADFNDVVIKVENEEDLNTEGNIVRIRGKYKFLARGAGYKHKLFVNLPNTGATITQKIYDGNQTLIKNISTHVDNLGLFPLFLKDSTFFANPSRNSNQVYNTHELCAYNSRPTDSYRECYSSEFEIIFDQSVNKSTNKLYAPYDIFIFVMNTNHEIHFPSLYFDSNNRDRYLDDYDFPWAVLIPSEWNWPYDGKYVTTGYPCFDEWYLSGGVNYTDWYLRTNSDSRTNLYNYFNNINYLSTEGCN